MTKLLSSIRNTALGLSLIIGSAQSFAADETKDDGKIREEMLKFSEETEKMREAHIQEMRDLHVKHINEMYDRKLANNKEMGVLWRQLKPGDKEANKALRKQIKDKQGVFHDEMEKFRKDFKSNVLEAKNKAFRESMKERMKGMKKKHKD